MNRQQAILLIGVCLAYILLRLWGLTDSCLWFDEIFSVHAAEHSWNRLFWFVAQDLIHPPLFYALLKVWVLIGGENLYWLRLFPVVFSALTLWPIYLLCRELKLRFPTLFLTFVLFAANGALIKYGQEVRMYSVLLFFSTVSIWLFSRFFFRGKNIWILTIVNALMIYTHYFGWFVLVAEIGVILIFQRIKIRHVLIMFAIEIVVFLPWIWALAKAAGTGASVAQNIGWIARPGVSAIVDFVFDLIEPFYFQQSSAEPPSVLYVSIPLLVVIAGAKMWYFAEWKRHERKDVLYIVALVAAIPIAFAFILSWVAPFSIWGSRHLIFTFVPASIASAIFLTSMEVKSVRRAVIGILVLIMSVALINRARQEKPQLIWCRWDELAVTVPRNGSVIYAFEDLAAYHLWFATRNDRVRIVKVNGVAGMTEDPAYFIPRDFDGIDVINAGDLSAERFFFAFRDPDWNETRPPMDLLTAKGYRIRKAGESQPAQGVSAFLGEAVK